ncbi:PaaI family thioesterase [Sphingomonas humi]|uniref:PaaI family thioesterase n=1 Tax=Sphingomonas humi TaxID=335630 RepID=A0ABP7RVF0_9SPHN
MEKPRTASPWPSHVIETGDWQGWTQFTADPFEEHAGPFFFRRADDGSITCAMKVETKHLNGGQFIHGGALMTFADYCLFGIAQDELHAGPAVTATFNGEFVASVPAGAVIVGTGEVIRATRHLIFVRGLMRSDGAPIFAFSGTLKRIRATAPDRH